MAKTNEEFLNELMGENQAEVSNGESFFLEGDSKKPGEGTVLESTLPSEDVVTGLESAPLQGIDDYFEDVEERAVEALKLKEQKQQEQADLFYRTAPQGLLDEYGLSLPMSPGSIIPFEDWQQNQIFSGRFSPLPEPQSIESWYEENSSRFAPVQATGNEEEDQRRLDALNQSIGDTYQQEVVDPINKTREGIYQSQVNAYNEEVYDPYKLEFDVYANKLKEFNETSAFNQNLLLREMDVSTYKAAVDAGDFSVVERAAERRIGGGWGGVNQGGSSCNKVCRWAKKRGVYKGVQNH